MLVSLPNRTHKPVTTFANLAKVALTAAQRSPKSRFGSACLLHRRSAKSSSGSFSPRHGGMDVRPASGAAVRKPTRTGGVRTDTTNKRGIARTQIPDVGDLGRIPTRTQIPDVGNLGRIAEVRPAGVVVAVRPRRAAKGGRRLFVVVGSVDASVADCRMHYLTMHEKQCMAVGHCPSNGIVPRPRCQSRRSRSPTMAVIRNA